MTEELDNQESLNPEQGDGGEPNNPQGDDEVAKAKEYARNQKIRAEKAEAELKALKNAPKEKSTPKNDKYSLDDIDDLTALSSVHREDRAWVLKVAEVEGKKPSEVLGLSYVKTKLRESDEMRASAEAANTGTSRKGVETPSPEAIIAKVKEQGDPASDEEAELLAQARMEEKMAKLKARTR